MSPEGENRSGAPPPVDPLGRTGAYQSGGPDAEQPTRLDLRSDLPEVPEVRLEREIGRGGMGVVYRGVQPYIDRRVAVKVLSREAARAPGFLDRFQREARILAGLVHPNIVACYQAGSLPTGECYLVMELVEGGNLASHVAEHGRLDEARALRVTLDLLKALEHAHSFGIIHRDVKPDNLLLGPASGAHASPEFPYAVKLADLGLAKPATGGDVQLTATGMVVGTPATMAPEQINTPDQVDFRADIYGAGCVLFFAVTGRHAFPGQNFTEIIVQKSRSDAPDPASLCPELSGDLCALVRGMLDPDPSRRPQSYADAIAEVERLLATRTTSRTARGAAPTRAPSPGAPPPPRPRRGVLLAVLVAVSVLAGVAGFVVPGLLGRREPASPPGAGDGLADPRPAPPPPVAAGDAEPDEAEPDEPAPDVPEPADGEVELGTPERLFGDGFGGELEGWKIEPAESWGPAEEIAGAIQGVGTGFAYRDLGRPPWQISGRILPWQDVEDVATGKVVRRLTLNEAAIVVRVQGGPSLALAVADVGGLTSIGLRRILAWPPGQLQVTDEGEDQVLSSPEAIPFQITVTPRAIRFEAMGKELAFPRLPLRARLQGVALVVRGEPQYSVRIADLEIRYPRRPR